MNKILIAEGTPHLYEKLRDRYEVMWAKTGSDVLRLIDEFAPQLLLIDLYLPELHGIFLVRKAKELGIGAILISDFPLNQNYHSAIWAGADFFLERPTPTSRLIEVIEMFFAGTLTQPHFAGLEPVGDFTRALPTERHHPSHYLKFWGTRGSNPVSGRDFVRFGGNTPCLEVRAGDDLIIIDAGTGIRPMGATLLHKEMRHMHLLISHTHWDHLIGFPFFPPLYEKETQLTIWSPMGYEKSTRELFTDMLAHAFFPVSLEEIHAKLIFKDIHEGIPFSVGSIKISAHYAVHPGSTLFFILEIDKKRIVYATDNEFLMGFGGDPKTITPDHPLLLPYARMLELMRGCDLLIHEAQYFPHEYIHRIGWGHTSISNGSVLAKLVRPKEWIITHHDPSHSDDILARKEQWHNDALTDLGVSCRVRLAYDGFFIPL